MRKVSCVALLLLVFSTQPALAQSRIFVSGDVFADSKWFSGDSALTLDATTVGGGGSVGVLVAERWDVRAEVGAGSTTTVTRQLLPPVTAFQSRTRNRITATSALVGFHPLAGPRVRFTVLGGVSFLRVSTAVDSIPPGLVVVTRTDVDNVAGPTLGVELPITLFARVSIVHTLRAHAFTSSRDGRGGFAIRPGVGVRWGL